MIHVKKYYQNSPPPSNIIEQIPNHFIKSTCLKLDNIIKNMPEIADLKEPLKSKNQRKCRHNSICFDGECRDAHTYTIKARKKIREAFLKEMKNEKINEIIQHISTSPQKPNQELWQSEIESLLVKYKLFEPECDNFDDCKTIISNKFIFLSMKISRIKKNIKNDKCKELFKKFTEELLLLRNEKIEEYNIKYNGQKLMTDYYKPITERTSKTSLYPEPSQILKEKLKIDNKVLRDYHLKILESAKEYEEELIKKKERQRLQQQEYEETKKKIKEQLHSLVEMPSRLFGRLMSSSSKKLDINEKINIWSDKIIEMISDLSAWKPERCENLDECIEKITIIIDIINSFLETPNTMINQELPENNNYNIQKNKIYKNFLENYKITFTDKELEHSQYLKLLEDYKQIIIVLQNMKLDDCKNTFSGGKKTKKLKSSQKMI